MKIIPEEHIGQTYGVYKIVDVLPTRNKHGALMFVGVCEQCGFEKTGT